jgi:hypothetical protein
MNKLPINCLANIISLLGKDWKSISNLRQTCKKFNLHELEPQLFETFSASWKIPLKFFVVFQDIREIIFRHCCESLKKMTDETKESIKEKLNGAFLRIHYKGLSYVCSDDGFLYPCDALEKEGTIHITWDELPECLDSKIEGRVNRDFDKKYNKFFRYKSPHVHIGYVVGKGHRK